MRQGEGLRRALSVLALAAALASACSGSSATKTKDGGDFPGLCANGSFTPSGSLRCAETFDAQTVNPTGIVGVTTSGACGGSLVWLAQRLNFDFACVYDPTTKMLAGVLQYTDTGGR